MKNNNMEYTDAVENEQYSTDPRVPLDHLFEDERGIIKNLLHTPIYSVAYITSKKGTERANHYHNVDHHYAFVLSGEIEYCERNIDGSNPRSWIFKTGDMFYTRPQIVHVMRFIQDTVFMTFSKVKKDHEHYEEDVKRVKF
jgi:quercetin dioxygenase-like cupin family protein